VTALIDTLDRPIRDLRISVTDRCNFRCVYCMPREVFDKNHVFLPRRELLSFEELDRLVRLFAEQGVRKLRLTGGEPLVRNDLEQLIEGFRDIKINMVVKRGMNEADVLPMAQYFHGSGHILRFIEFMDVGNANGWQPDAVFNAQQIVDTINAALPLEAVEPNYTGEVAKRWRYADGGGEIGVIASVSQPFCGDCHRARRGPCVARRHPDQESRDVLHRRMIRRAVSDAPHNVVGDTRLA